MIKTITLVMAALFIFCVTVTVIYPISLYTHGGTIEREFFAMLFICTAGTALYRVRCLMPLLYGVSEIVAGMAIAWCLLKISLGNLPNSVAAVLATMGALYVIVRGYDNVYRSLRSPDVILFWNRYFFCKDTDEKL
jgi:hypothetical protein